MVFWFSSCKCRYKSICSSFYSWQLPWQLQKELHSLAWVSGSIFLGLTLVYISVCGIRQRRCLNWLQFICFRLQWPFIVQILHITGLCKRTVCFSLNKSQLTIVNWLIQLIQKYVRITYYKKQLIRKYNF